MYPLHNLDSQNTCHYILHLPNSISNLPSRGPMAQLVAVSLGSRNISSSRLISKQRSTPDRKVVCSIQAGVIQWMAFVFLVFLKTSRNGNLVQVLSGWKCGAKPTVEGRTETSGVGSHRNDAKSYLSYCVRCSTSNSAYGCDVYALNQQ